MSKPSRETDRPVDATSEAQSVGARTASSPSRRASTTVAFDDRLLVLGVASFEHAAATPIDDRAANAAAIASAPDAAPGAGPAGIATIERRLVARARGLDVSEGVGAWLDRLRGASRVVFIAAVVVVALLGWGAAHTALGFDRSRPTNIYWLLGGVLLPQTIILLAWMALNLFGSAATAALSAGGALRALFARLVARRLGREPTSAAAGAAMALAFGRGALARWTIGVATNALWTSFNVGCLLGVILVLTLEQHTFCWESTLLSSAGYERFTRAIAWLPQHLGFATPDSAKIAAARFDPTLPSQFPAQDDAARAAWSGLLVGSVVTYGLSPRLLLLGLCLGLRRRARAAFRLDPDGPLLAAAAARLSPTRTALAPSSASSTSESWRDEPPRAGASRGAGSPASADAPGANGTPSAGGPAVLIGLELAVPTSGWPPAALAGAVDDFGRIESREDRRAVLARLRAACAARPSPRCTIVVASLASTPDRGLGHLIDEIGSMCGASAVRLVLTAGESMRRRGDATSVAQRAADWRSLAARAGIADEQVVEIDLDLLTAASAARLRGLVEPEGPREREARGASDARAADGARDAAGARMLAEQREAGESDRATAGVSARQLERAFAIIGDAASSWAGEPSLAAQAELHRRIAQLYASALDSNADGAGGGAPGGLSRMRAALGGAAERLAGLDPRQLGANLASDVTGHLGGDIVDGLRTASERMTALLPDALRRSPRWLAAGAIAGALGCVAAATVAAPVAIAALPMWSAVGAAIGGALALARSASHANDRRGAPDDPDVGEGDAATDIATAVRAAALVAVVLEFQGGGEARIARILEGAFPEPDPSPPSAASARQWLAGVRHRIDLALLRQSSATRAQGPARLDSARAPEPGA